MRKLGLSSTVASWSQDVASRRRQCYPKFLVDRKEGKREMSIRRLVTKDSMGAVLMSGQGVVFGPI